MGETGNRSGRYNLGLRATAMLLSKARKKDIVGNKAPDNMVAAEERLELLSEGFFVARRKICRRPPLTKTMLFQSISFTNTFQVLLHIARG